MRDERERELEGILEHLSYELTAARTAGIARPEALRTALRKARQLLDDAEGLAAGAQVEARETSSSDR